MDMWAHYRLCRKTESFPDLPRRLIGVVDLLHSFCVGKFTATSSGICRSYSILKVNTAASRARASRGARVNDKRRANENDREVCQENCVKSKNQQTMKPPVIVYSNAEKSLLQGLRWSGKVISEENTDKK